jgi:hypothetical protein
MRIKPTRIIGQAVAYAAFVAFIGYFSFSPAHTHADPQMAVIKLSFSHGGARKGGCRRFTPEEIAALPPNMRRPMDCPRERVPVLVELHLDGGLLYRESLLPAGLSRGGQSSTFQRFQVPPGEHHLVARLRDSERDEGFDYESEARVVLGPRQNFVIEFNAAEGEFGFL